MKMELGFGGGSDNFILDVRNGNIYSYEQHREFLHHEFGGEATYTSRTGMSGDGYLEIELHHAVRLGGYRTDSHPSPFKGDAITHDEFGNGIYGFVPFESHKGISHGPLVLSDGKNVAFLDIYMGRYQYTSSGETHQGQCPTVDIEVLKSTILNWASNWSKKEFEFFDEYGRLSEGGFGFHNPSHLGGIDCRYFLWDTLEEARNEAKEAVENCEQPHHRLYHVLNLIKTSSGWFHKNQFGYLDQYFSSFPLEVEDGVIGPWEVYPKEKCLLKPLPKGEVDVIIWNYRSTMGYEYPNCEDLIEFESRSSKLWLHENIQEAHKELETKAHEEWARQRIQKQKASECINIIRNNPDVVISDETAKSLGYCQPGIKDFRERFGLKKSEYSFAKIVQFDNAEQMAQCHMFRAVVDKAVNG